MSPERILNEPIWKTKLRELGVLSKGSELKNALGKAVSVEMWGTPQGGTFPIHDRLKSSEGFRGSNDVDMMVYYPAEMYRDLRGYSYGTEEKWTPEAMKERGIVDMSVFDEEASFVSSEITRLSRKILKGEATYDDPDFYLPYREQAKRGYELLDKLAPSFGMSKEGKKPVVLLRAGEPATKFTYGEDYKEEDTVRINEKRGHLAGEDEGDVALMMYGVTEEKLRELDGADIIINDPAFATGSSLLAVVLAMEKYGYKPRSIELRSLAATRLGLELTEQIMKDKGIEFKAAVLAIGGFLSDRYYIGDLDHDPVVADAGDALCGTASQG